MKNVTFVNYGSDDEYLVKHKNEVRNSEISS